MKKVSAVLSVLITLFIVVVLAGGSEARLMKQGTRELDINGSYDQNTGAGSFFYTALGYGYYIRDDLELAVAGALMFADTYTGIHPAVSMTYDFETGTDWVPFVEANLGYGYWDFKPGTKSGFVYGGGGGIKYFLANNVAISLAVDYDIASEDLFEEKNGGWGKTNLGMHYGLRYYL